MTNYPNNDKCVRLQTRDLRDPETLTRVRVYRLLAPKKYESFSFFVFVSLKVYTETKNKAHNNKKKPWN